MRAAVFLGLICIALEIQIEPTSDRHADFWTALFMMFLVMDISEWLKNIFR